MNPLLTTSSLRVKHGRRIEVHEVLEPNDVIIHDPAKREFKIQFYCERTDIYLTTTYDTSVVDHETFFDILREIIAAHCDHLVLVHPEQFADDRRRIALRA